MIILLRAHLVLQGIFCPLRITVFYTDFKPTIHVTSNLVHLHCLYGRHCSCNYRYYDISLLLVLEHC